MTPPLRDLGLKSCAACGIGCLLLFVSKRLDYLLSSLSLCLRFATLTQFPPTSDFRCIDFACQGSIASLAAIFAPSVDGDYTAPEQDSRAAADDRSRGKSYSSFNAATPRYGQCNRQALQLFELLACNGKRLSFGRATPVFFLGKENGGRITRHLCRIDIRTCAKKEEFSFEKENIPLDSRQRHRRCHPLCAVRRVKTTRKTGGLHKPYKGLRQAAPKGAVKRSADRI